MSAILAIRNLVLRPWRTAFLLFGYGLGVAVMIVLLSVGEALLTQARDERLVGGGEITVLPEGIDIEVMKTGGLGGMFFSIDHARFIYRQLLAGERVRRYATSVAPQIDGKLLYLRGTNGREVSILASGDIPSRSQALGALPPLASGSWTDDSLDVGWRDPTSAQLRHDIDHFHLPPPEARGDPTWAEWHYFNVLWPDRRHWAFVTLMVGGAVPNGRWGGEVLITLNDSASSRRFVALLPPTSVHMSTNRADLELGGSSVSVLPDGRYQVHAHATEERGPATIDIDLLVTPSPGQYFSGAALSSGALVSGYVVPALRAGASGRVCVDQRCESLRNVQAYHDHNWGVWRGVTWEWGAARAGSYTFLYGRVQPADSTTMQPLFVYVTDSLGFLGLFRPTEIRYDDSRRLRVSGRTIHVPARATMVDVRGDDTLQIALTIESAMATDTRQPTVEGGASLSNRALAKPYFIQMKGTAEVSGRVSGRPLSGKGSGFFETYR